LGEGNAAWSTCSCCRRIPQGAQPIDFFRQFLEGKFPGRPDPEQGRLGLGDQGRRQEKEGRPRLVLHREDGEVEVEIEHDAIRYEGPRIMPKDVQDVLHPVRCENLQIPGPSNPMGAAHVILRDFPSIDEIKRLSMGDHPFYDMVSDEELEKIGVARRMDESSTRSARSKRHHAGGTEHETRPSKGSESHAQLTRLMCFDCYDVDGDGKSTRT
jgi:hypothetical protein